MTPAASRTTLAGLLLAGAWLTSAGVAAAQDDGGDGEAASTTTTTPSTTVPATTSTTALQAILSGKDPVAVAFDSYKASREQPAPAPEPGPLAGAPLAEDVVHPEETVDLPSVVPGLLGPEVTGATGGALAAADSAAAAQPVAAARPSTPVPPAARAGGGGVTTGDGSLPTPIPGPDAAALAATPASSPTGGGHLGPAPTPVSTAATPDLTGGATALEAAAPNGPGDTGQAENPERGPPTTIATGDASSTGNRSDTTIDQTHIVIALEEGTLDISTVFNPDTGIGSVNGTLPDGETISAGVPAAVAGLRSSSPSSRSTGSGAARIDTGDATATGNDSVTTINQTNVAVVLTDNAHLDMGLNSHVSNLGAAGAATGDNTTVGGIGTGDGSAAIATGDATATGNHSKTVINQTNAVVVTGNDSSVNLEQSADVDNIGVANATTGDNSALGGGTGTSGTASVTTGDATANGNVSTTTITQNNTAIILGDRSTVTAAQQADVTNQGAAKARTGGNTAIGGTGDGDGSGIVDTGDATANGNVSTTTVDHSGTAVILGQDSWADLSQSTHVGNRGDALADSGNNAALGQAA